MQVEGSERSRASFNKDHHDAFEMVFGAVKTVMEISTSEKVLVLVCDARMYALGGAKPMNEPLLDFGPKWIRRGALLLTGTTDNEFVSDLPHHGLEDHIMYHVGEWGSKEFDFCSKTWKRMRFIFAGR